MSQGTLTVGIIGGMGPSATYDLAQKIVDNTLATCDQEHLHVLVDCDTNIPDRNAAILRGGPSPVPEIVRAGKRLQTAGAELLLMPCNTSHHFLPEISEQLDVPLLGMPEETARALRGRGADCVSVLCTEGTRGSGVYDKALEAAGMRAIYPDEAGQALVTAVIYDYVKCGRMDFDREGLVRLVEQLRAQGAQACLLACTELPLAFADMGDKVPADVREMLVDPTDVLARAAIVRAGGTLREG